jgi:DNA-directed RNA polymerase specialized sigma24 family protein
MVASLLERAQGGDDDAFGDLVAPYRAELHLHCYRMLGSLADADDVLQDTMIAAWRAIGGFCGRSSLRTWMYRIATNRCLNAIRDAKRRPPPVPWRVQVLDAVDCWRFGATQILRDGHWHGRFADRLCVGAMEAGGSVVGPLERHRRPTRSTRWPGTGW